MRPSVTEQLHRTTQVLREVVLPHVADTDARRAAESVIAGLDLVAEAWHRIVPFLVWDNSEMTRLLQQRGAAPTPAELDPLDFAKNHERNEELRAQLEAVISRESGEDAEILDHLDLRARRYPLRYIPTLNAHVGNEEG